MLLLVGDAETPLFVSEKLLTAIPTFEKMLCKEHSFREQIEKKIKLPEDDLKLWRKAIDFVYTGEFYPRLTSASRNEVDNSNTVIFYQDWLDQKHTSVSFPSLETALKIVNKDGRLREFTKQDIRIGDWTPSEYTHDLFDEIVCLFCMGNKYAWEGLIELCLKKLMAFPLGGRAFATLVTYCTSFDIPAKEDNDNDEGEQSLLDGEDCARYKLLRLMNELYAYHTVAYDHTKALSDVFGKKNDEAYVYLDEYFRNNMTEEAWAVFQKLAATRSKRTQDIRGGLTSESWFCQRYLHGIHEHIWTKELAAEAWESHQPSSQGAKLLDDSSIPPSRDQSNGELLGPGYSFTEAMTGDVITSIVLDQPEAGFLYGFVQRTQSWGWFSAHNVRLLEQKSQEDCWCSCCRTNSSGEQW